MSEAELTMNAKEIITSVMLLDAVAVSIEHLLGLTDFYHRLLRFEFMRGMETYEMKL